MNVMTGNNIDMLGKEVVFCAYIGDDRNSGASTEYIWIHYRFRWFDMVKFENGLTDRKNNASQIFQHHTPLCGVAAIMYFFIDDYNVLFYNTFMEFFKTGEGKINQYKLSPDKSLYDMKPLQNNKNYPRYTEDYYGNPLIYNDLMDHADWITLAGTRSSENKRYEGKDGENWDGINWVEYMKKTIQQVYEIEEVIDATFYTQSVFRGKKFNVNTKVSFHKIQSLFDSGYHVILMIDADMLDDIISTLGCISNYHWIPFLGKLNIDEVNMQYFFKYYSWQKEYSRTFDASVIESNFYGYIAFKKKTFLESAVGQHKNQ